jgi:HEAT repeats
VIIMDPRFRHGPLIPHSQIVTAIALMMAMTMVNAGEQAATPSPKISAPVVEPAGGGVGSIDMLVKDALDGSSGAISTLRTAALNVDDRSAMAILDKVRATRASRSSAVAACFVRHREAWVQRTAISTIAKLGADSPETIDLLVKTIVDAQPLVAQAAADALSDLRDARSWPALMDLLNAKEPNQVRLALDSLQRQTKQRLPAEHGPWEDWYRARKADEEAQFTRYQGMLADPTGGNGATAVDGLASLQLMRDQATAVLISLVDHPDAAVRTHVEHHLRQWTGTIGTESLTAAVERAQDHAVAPPSPPPAIVVAKAAPLAAVSGPTAAAPGFFETTYGMLLIVTICSTILGTLLWFLRTPAGKVVQHATQQLTKRIARTRVAVMVSNGTKRIAKHIPGPVRSMTRRFTAPAKVVANHLANETQRMLNPHKPK